jgi:hypothetical protein
VNFERDCNLPVAVVVVVAAAATLAVAAESEWHIE